MIRFQLHIFSRLILLTHLKMHCINLIKASLVLHLNCTSFLSCAPRHWHRSVLCSMRFVFCWVLASLSMSRMEVGVWGWSCICIRVDIFICICLICLYLCLCLYLCSAVWCLSLSRLVGGRRSRCQRFSRDYSNGGNTEQSHSVIYRPTCHIWRHIYKHMIVCRE